MERDSRNEANLTEDGRYRLLVESVTDYAIYMLDPEGRIANWNVGAERIKGYAAEEVLGRHFSLFYTDEDRATGLPDRALTTAAREGRFESEGWRVRKDGSRFWANAVVDAIRDERGELVGFAKVTRDITERRQAERALEETRAAFFQAQKMEAIGQLTGGIAHDFNNILMTVLGSLEMLRKRVPDDPRITRLLDNALHGAQRGTSLTQRLLAFARRQVLDLRPVDVPALVHGMSDLLQRSLGQLVTLETRFPESLPAVRADANQLELALLNLATNARDAMPSGGVLTIAARAETVTPDRGIGLVPGRYVCLYVQDAGEGMDADTLSRAMEPFFTTKGVGKGTGLGLSMVHGLAEQSGGRLILRSRKGEGTTAELWLPATVAGAVLPDRASYEFPSVPMARPLVVLVVDDDELVLANTAALLEDLGHHALTACSGRDALDLLRRPGSIDVMVTDHAMPHMTGLQLVAGARQIRPDLPVILASGFAELPPDARIDLPRLPKPYGQADLARAIAEILKSELAPGGG